MCPIVLRAETSTVITYAQPFSIRANSTSSLQSLPFSTAPHLIEEWILTPVSLYCCKKHPTRATQEGKGLLWANKVCLIIVGKVTAGTGRSRSYSAGTDSCWCPAPFLLFILSKNPAHGMVLPTFRECLPTSLTESRDSLTDMPVVCFHGGSESCPVDSWD